MRSTLTSEQRKASYCQHLIKGREACDKQQKASDVAINSLLFNQFHVDGEHLEILKKNCNADGYLHVYNLPGNIMAVPSLLAMTHDNPLKYLHIRNNRCPLQICKEQRSKLHTLMKKENPLCLHTFLTYCAKGIINEGRRQENPE